MLLGKHVVVESSFIFKENYSPLGIQSDASNRDLLDFASRLLQVTAEGP